MSNEIWEKFPLRKLRKGNFFYISGNYSFFWYTKTLRKDEHERIGKGLLRNGYEYYCEKQRTIYLHF